MGTALAPSEAYPSLACLRAGIEVTKAADFIAIPVFEQHVTLWVELIVAHDAGSIDVEKSHRVLLIC
jgi:hypothetical protein